MIEAVERHFPAGTRVTSPAGGHILWLQLPEGVDSLQLYEEALPLGITVAPGCLFGSTPERYRNFIRLNAAHMSDETLPALRTLAALAGQKDAGNLPRATAFPALRS
jgi:DNA-binding transcriptional MocR family regulator